MNNGSQTQHHTNPNNNQGNSLENSSEINRNSYLYNQFKGYFSDDIVNSHPEEQQINMSKFHDQPHPNQNHNNSNSNNNSNNNAISTA